MLVPAVSQSFYYNQTLYKMDTSIRRTTDILKSSTDTCEVLNVTANYDLGKKNSCTRLFLTPYEEGQGVDFEPPAPTIKSTTEALRLVNDVKEFASTTLQDENLVSKLSSVGQRFEDFKLLHLKQSTITDFFSSLVHAHQSHGY